LYSFCWIECWSSCNKKKENQIGHNKRDKNYKKAKSAMSKNINTQLLLLTTAKKIN